jgi:hypothetical protein
MTPPGLRRRLRWLFAVLLVSVPVAGCSLLEDEFTSLDRAAPAALRAPDAPTSGLVERP